MGGSQLSSVQRVRRNVPPTPNHHAPQQLGGPRSSSAWALAARRAARPKLEAGRSEQGPPRAHHAVKVVQGGGHLQGNAPPSAVPPERPLIGRRRSQLQRTVKVAPYTPPARQETASGDACGGGGSRHARSIPAAGAQQAGAPRSRPGACLREPLPGRCPPPFFTFAEFHQNDSTGAIQAAADQAGRGGCATDTGSAGGQAGLAGGWQRLHGLRRRAGGLPRRLPRRGRLA